MEQILKSEIVAILNSIQRGNAPTMIENETIPKYVETSKHKFDLVDSRDGLPIREFKTGTAHYINGAENDTYNLKIICYDDFIHQFTFDDGKGHTNVSRLKDGVSVADFLIYEQSESKSIFIVHELSNEVPDKKIRKAKSQLSDTLNQLYKSEEIGRYIDGFKQKLCYLSAKDSRSLVESEGMADGFNEIYKVLPKPISFNWGQINTHKFSAFETSFVQLKK
jgi:hypothetical protein